MLRRVSPGATIRADDINQIIDHLETRLRVTGGQGISAAWGDAGLLLALATQQEYVVPAIVTANGGDTPRIADDVRYSVVGIGRPGVELIDVLPAFGRPIKGEEAGFTKIRPAKVGSFCFVLRAPQQERGPDGRLWIGCGGEDGETVYARRCTVTP